MKKIAVIGLGYVGLPLAVEFAKKFDVVGFDLNKKKIEHYLAGHDVTCEVGDDAVKNTTCVFTDDERSLKKCNFYIIAVPTPINSDKTPDLKPVISASEVVGRNLSKGSIVVYESTVFPGTTEEICIPILERESRLVYGIDFKAGYSPERINPGDKTNTLTKIVKIVSGCDEETLEAVAATYGSIIEAGVYRAESIKVAEAAKVIENSQRDVNIAFMNELSMVFNKMNISTKSVLDAAGSKWNFLKFTPGLVGGHCIGVDPYYFTYKAEQLGYHSQIIIAGRKINEDMGKYIAENIIKQLIKIDCAIKGTRVGILGISFKENCADVRNTKVIDIIRELKEFGVETIVHDPVVNKEDVWEEYEIELVDDSDLKQLDCIVIAVAHNIFKSHYSLDYLISKFKADKGLIIDIKNIFSRNECGEKGLYYWSL